MPEIERSAAALFAGQPGLEHLATGDVLPLADHRRFRRDGQHLVAELHGELSGFLVAELLDGSLHIRELSVARSAQGKGLGRALIDAAVAAARNAKLPAVTLTTFRAVPWNAPFYARCGFALLDPEQASPALAQILAEEEAHGMPPGSRCAMRRDLS